jgi:hypothetical protein
MADMERLTVISPKRQLRPHDGILRRSFRVGPYTVTITHDLDSFEPGVVSQTNIQWSPDRPARLSAAEIKFYRKRRNAIFQEIADTIGGKIMVADV